METPPARPSNRNFLIGLARGFAGANIFAIPLYMTMEMWWLGYTMDRIRLAIFLVAAFPLLVALARVSGFRESGAGLLDHIVDAFVAYAIGFLAPAIPLALFSLFEPARGFDSLVALLALQAVPSAIGAALARSLLGREGNGTPDAVSYGQELMVMAGGGLYLAFNLVPTEEVSMLAARITGWHALGLLGFTLVLMHAFVYGVAFRGEEHAPRGQTVIGEFFRFTVVGYALVLALGLFLLWTFGRTDHLGLTAEVKALCIVAFPAGLGAAAARLIL